MKILIKIMLFFINSNIVTAAPRIEYPLPSLSCQQGSTETQRLFKESFREYQTAPPKRKFLFIRACEQRVAVDSVQRLKKTKFKLTKAYYLYGEEDPKFGLEFNIYPATAPEYSTFKGTLELTKIGSHGNYVSIQNQTNTLWIKGNFYYNSGIKFYINEHIYPASVINNN